MRLQHPQPHRVAGARHLGGPHPELEIPRVPARRSSRRQRVRQRRSGVLVARDAPLELRDLCHQRIALRGQRLHPRLELRAPQLHSVQRPQRLRGHPRLRLLGRLGAPRPPLGQHRAVDDLAPGPLVLLRLRHRRHGRARVEPGHRRHRRLLAAAPLEPQRAVAHQRLRRQVRAPPHAPVAQPGARGVGQRLEPRRLPAPHGHAQHRQALRRRHARRPPPAHAHQPALGARRQPLDDLEREAVEDRGRGRFGHAAPWSQTVRRSPAGPRTRR